MNAKDFLHYLLNEKRYRNEILANFQQTKIG